MRTFANAFLSIHVFTLVYKSKYLEFGEKKIFQTQ